jgi:hypothetical protein
LSPASPTLLPPSPRLAGAPVAASWPPTCEGKNPPSVAGGEIPQAVI